MYNYFTTQFKKKQQIMANTIFIISVTQYTVMSHVPRISCKVQTVIALYPNRLTHFIFGFIPFHSDDISIELDTK